MDGNEQASESSNTSVDQPQYQDQVSKLQGNLEKLCSLLYTSIGSLQRDAPPQDLDGEMILKPRQQAVLQYNLEVCMSSLFVYIFSIAPVLPLLYTSYACRIK